MSFLTIPGAMNFKSRMILTICMKCVMIHRMPSEKFSRELRETLEMKTTVITDWEVFPTESAAAASVTDVKICSFNLLVSVYGSKGTEFNPVKRPAFPKDIWISSVEKTLYLKARLNSRV